MSWDLMSTLVALTSGGVILGIAWYRYAARRDPLPLAALNTVLGLGAFALAMGATWVGIILALVGVLGGTRYRANQRLGTGA